MSLPEFSQTHHVEAERARIEAVRRMSPERKLDIAADLYWSAREMKAASFRYFHPEWPEAQVQAEVRRVFLHARP